LARGDAIAARRIQPDGDVAFAGEKVFLERRRCDVVVEPALFGDDAVEIENAGACIGIPRPVPEAIDGNQPLSKVSVVMSVNGNTFCIQRR